jgi:hypothetical protein
MSRCEWLLSLAKGVLLSLAACALLPAGLAWGQQGKGPSSTEEARVMLPRDGADKLDKQYNSKDFREQLSALTKGTAQPSDANKEVIDKAAQWHIYRVTWTLLQSEPERMELTYQQFSRILTEAQKGRQNTEKFLQQFTRQCLVCLKEVLQNDRAIARINGARMLARLAGTGQEEVLDLLVEVLKDPKQTDAVKLYVLRGLHDFFALTRGENAIRIRDEEREKRCVLAMLEYLNRKSSLSESGPPEEAAAVVYLRREADKALGETRFPALISKDKKPLPEGLTALSLLKVLRKDGVSPEPSLSEQVEAAIALCQLNAELVPDYQPDYVVTQLGRFLVEFTQRCLEEREQKREPWRVDVLRMQQALEDLKFGARRTPYSDYVNKFVAQAKPILETLEKSGTPRAADMDAWLNQNPPKGTSVYKGIDSSVIKAPEKGG